VKDSGDYVLTASYSYRNIDGTYTCTQVSSKSQTFGSTTLTLSYTYDANGNILSVSDGTDTTTYTYDDLNQLIWEYNEGAGKAWNYSYDLGGNILTKTEYDYADGETSNPTTVNYTYGDSTWGDLLTAYDGETISHDGIGNPLNLKGWALTWQGGRQLASMSKNDESLSFSYNESGLRTKKTVGTAETSYYYNGTALTAEVTDDYELYFRYDSSGNLIGFTHKAATAETEYFYVKNLQGDILKVIDSTGTVKASYSYDAWGNILTATGDMAEINPLRYRGYYYDTETGWYYLQSRYYDPGIGRFVNADAVLNPSTVLGYSLFAYCVNNPTNMSDTTGNIPFFIITAAIGAVVGAVVGGVVAAKNGGNVWAGIGIGAAAGALIGTGAGMAAGAALAGSITATTGAVMAGGSTLVATVGTGGLGAGASYIANNLSKTVNNLAPAVQSSASKMQQVVEKGKAGELAAGITKNHSHIESLTGTAHYRIPDMLDRSAKILGEVKNYSGTISLTAQLKDFVLWSQLNGYKMYLYTNSKSFTGPLQQLIDNRVIEVFPIGK